MRWLINLGRKATGTELRGSRRRRPRPSWMRPVLRRGAPLVAVVAVALTGIALVESGWVDRRLAAAGTNVLDTSAKVGLAVDSILVHGRHRTDRDAVAEALGARRGDPIMAFDPEIARLRLEALPWVKAAIVERSLPSTLRIRLEEREPLARWQHQHRLVLMGADGDLIPVRDLSGFEHLPIVVGRNAHTQAPALFALLKEHPGFAERMTAAVLVSERRWNVHLDGRVEVRLPEFGASRALAWLADVEHEHGVLERDIRAIDLRLPDRFVVKLAPGAEARLGDPGRST